MEATIEKQSMKKCNCCGNLLPISEFHRNNQSKDGFLSTCKVCRKIKYHHKQSTGEICSALHNVYSNRDLAKLPPDSLLKN